jgi:integrase
MNGNYYISINKAKGNKNRFTNISESLYNEILNYCGLFCLDENSQIIRTYTGKPLKDTKSLREMIEKYTAILKEKGLVGANVKLTPHKFREMAITDRVDKWGVYEASKFAGHGNIETTTRYDNILTQFENTKNSEIFE